MPFKKGQSGNPNGRPAGIPNKDTAHFKESLSRLLDAADLEELLRGVPLDRRLEVLGKLAEFCHPRLGRSEVTGKDGGDLTITVVEYRDPDPAE